ncbi:hypothetical protein, partial [Victivallis vadensis]|uniref:hypothetical protein n=1 Tax=Victivallis vadensis TaxID=172901 RepID=UPI0026713148
ADAVADRSGVPLLYNLACLYRSLPHPEGKPERFSRISSIRRRHLAGRGAGAKRPARCDQQRNPGLGDDNRRKQGKRKISGVSA